MFAHGRLWSSGGAEKQSSKRSTFSALSFSQSVGDVMGGFDFDGMVVGASVGPGVGSEVWRSFIQSF